MSTSELNTTNYNINSVPYARLNAEPPNWAMSWCLSPILRIILAVYPSTRQPPRDHSGYSGAQGRTFLEFFQTDQQNIPKGIIAIDLRTLP